jgi:hypothetical protein
MLYGLPPPTHKETPKILKEIFVEKEKILEKKYVDFLEKVVKTFKDFEHEKKIEIKGVQVDKFLSDAEAYLKRLKELRKQIEKKTQEKTIDEIYSNVFNMLKEIFGKKSESILISEFEKNFIRRGKLPESYLRILKDLVKAKKDFKKGKLDKREVENVRKNVTLLINRLIDYNQRCELISMQKGRLRLKVKEKVYELILTDKLGFLIDRGGISKINIEKGKVEKSDVREMTDALEQQSKKSEIKFDERLFDIIKKKIGKFEIIL